MATRTDTTTASSFHNLSDGQLADALAEADASAKTAEARAKALKAELDRRGVVEASGEIASVKRVEATRWNLDLAAAKAKLGEAWVSAHSRVSAVTSWRLGPARPLAA